MNYVPLHVAMFIPEVYQCSLFGILHTACQCSMSELITECGQTSITLQPDTFMSDEVDKH